MKTKVDFLLAASGLILAACSSIGPGSVARGRFDHSASTGEKEPLPLVTIPA